MKGERHPPRFIPRSGPWEGYWIQPPPCQHLMLMHLCFVGGRVTGIGHDEIGGFEVAGSFSPTGLVEWTKAYETHSVKYWGNLTSDGIHGTWWLSRCLSGAFAVWPLIGTTDPRRRRRMELRLPAELLWPRRKPDQPPPAPFLNQGFGRFPWRRTCSRTA